MRDIITLLMIICAAAIGVVLDLCVVFAVNELCFSGRRSVEAFAIVLLLAVPSAVISGAGAWYVLAWIELFRRW